VHQDTIEVDRPIEGEGSIRLIDIDTPETVDPGEPVQPLGPEAAAFTAKQLEGQDVALEFDEERIDSFDRTLAYVWSSRSELFNETLVAEGLAQVATFRPTSATRSACSKPRRKREPPVSGYGASPPRNSAS
jgi:micrococcal nuclease